MADEIDVAVIKKTQEILGSVIKKPALTEKSLRKPPFRFLHDVISNVIKTTGFMKGLYAPEELQSENIKDKEGKIAFLQKAIDVLSLVINQPVNLKPSKVVAGHEPQRTNEFLQTLGQAIKNKLDSKEAVQKILREKGSVPNHKERRVSIDKKASTQKGSSEKAHLRTTTRTLDPVKKPAQSNQAKESTSKESTKTKSIEKTRSRSKDPKAREREKTKDKSQSKRDDSKSRVKTDSKTGHVSKTDVKHLANDESAIDVKSTAEYNGHIEAEDGVIQAEETPNLNGNVPEANYIPNGDITSENHNEVLNDEPVSPKPEKTRPESARRQSSGHLTRPPSARSKRTKPSGENEEIAAIFAAESASASQLHVDTTPRESLSPFPRPPSARPASSRPAPPRIRIRHVVENEEIRPPTAKPVENVILDKSVESEDEDETFVVAEEQTENLEPPVKSSLPAETPEEDRGSLVKQLLETKKDLEGGSQQPSSRKTELDKSQMSSAAQIRARESSSKELEQLRLFIQSVSKAAHPLGRMLDYVQEDTDSMKMELQMWREEHKQNLIALRKEKSITETILEPLRVQLDDLDQVVQDQIDANSALKASILRNDERIQRMLAAVKRKS